MVIRLRSCMKMKYAPHRKKKSGAVEQYLMHTSPVVTGVRVENAPGYALVLGCLSFLEGT